MDDAGMIIFLALMLVILAGTIGYTVPRIRAWNDQDRLDRQKGPPQPAAKPLKDQLVSMIERDPTIMRGSGAARYSVADELVKWKRLLDDGVITREEYERARKSLL